jgi:endo-1,4-beta-xylanase
VNAWNGGFVADLPVTGTNTSGWAVTVTLPAGVTVTGVWNATSSGSTGTVTFRNLSYNTRLPGSFGFQATGNGAIAVTSCTAT